MKIFNKITNGILLIIIAFLHTGTALSPEGGGKQFLEAYHSHFFKISGGMDDLPIASGKMNLELLTFSGFFILAYCLFH